MPPLAADGLLLAGDSAAMTLAAGPLARRRELRDRLGVRGGHRRATARCPHGDTTRHKVSPRTAPSSSGSSCSPTTGACARRRPSSSPSASSGATRVCSAISRTGCSRSPTRRRSSGPSASPASPRPSHGVKLRQLAARHPPRTQDLRMSVPRGRRREGSRWRGISFEDRMATVDFRVGERAHITVDSDVCRSCTTRACVTACPGQPVRTDRGRRNPLQLRGVLRMRDLLHDLQRRGRDHLDLSRRRVRRRLPSRMKTWALRHLR